MRALFAALLLSTIVLAGCSGGGGGGKTPGAGDTPQAAEIDVDPRSRLGAISGVVVDQAIRPITGANVALTQGGNTSTDEGGRFAFVDLEPGVYFFTVSATGFLATQGQADVVPGAAATARVQLQPDLTPVAYHETFSKDGFIQYGASIATFAANLVMDEFLDQGTCNCYVQFNTGPGAVAIVIEATWDPAIACPAGTSDDMYWQVYEGDTEDIHIESAFASNPIHAVIDKVEAWGENQTAFEASVTEGADCPRYNQQYKAFYTVWYLDFPPEGWSIVAATT